MSDNKRELESLNIDQTIYKTHLSKKYKDRAPYEPLDVSKVICYIPGTIVDIKVSVGDEVEEGKDLLILEAMKMKNKIKSPATGIIRRIDVKVGDKVAKGDLLIKLI